MLPQRCFSSLNLESFDFLWRDTVESTQDEAKQHVLQLGEHEERPFAVAASRQTKGRGTRGRNWVGIDGNVFVTIAVPFDGLPQPVTKIPLLVGSAVAREVHDTLRALGCARGDDEGACPKVRVKWPNDVLVNDEKISGVLLETELPYLLIGIGVNVVEAPEQASMDQQGGRSATSLADHVALAPLGEEGAPVEATMARCITARVLEAVASGSLEEWKGWVDFGKEQVVRESGRRVKPVEVRPDGALVVQDVHSGDVDVLVSQYLE